MKTYTKDNNILIASIHFLNWANYENAFKGLPVVMKGFTGWQLKEKKRLEKSVSKSKQTMKKIWGGKK